MSEADGQKLKRPELHEAIDVGAVGLPVVIDIGGVGDGKYRAPLGSDGRFLCVVGITDAAGVRCAAERSRLEVEWG